jgi:hypothetical protein
MKIVSPDRLEAKYGNKYLGLNVAALEARRIIEGMHKDEIQLAQSPYEYALDKALAGEIKWAKLTEADIEALARESYDEPPISRFSIRPQPIL